MIPINLEIINKTAEKARESERKRYNYNFHKDKSDVIQRILNVVQPGSKVEPHMHDNKTEVFLALKGKIKIIEWNNNGELKESYVIEPNGENCGVEVQPKTWHSMEALEPDSAVYIAMTGPYDKKTHKVFAPWLKK